MTDWYVHHDGVTTGPFPSAHVAQWLSSRQLPGTALFWPDGGGGDWLSLSEAWPQLAGGRQPDDVRADRKDSPAANNQAAPNNQAPNNQANNQAANQWSALNRQASDRDNTPTVAAEPLATQVDRDAQPDDTYPGQATYTAPYSGDQTGPQQVRGGALSAFTDRLNDFAGVERIRGFRVGELLSLAFSRHSRDEIEQNFATGLPGFVPPLERIESDWFKPWMFVRFYGAASLLFLAFVAMVKIFANANLVPGMIMVGSFVVPIAVLVFFFEANTPRNVSLYTVMHAFLVGGVLSMAIALVLLQLGASERPILGPLTVAVLEEVGKLLAVFVIAMRLPGRRYPWILNGMLFGAAVGAGFAAFESAGYALIVMLTDPSTGLDINATINNIFLRGALAPFGHVVWTALVGGALWRVKRDSVLAPRMLVDTRVLRVLGLVIALHFLWDMGVPLPFLLSYVVLGALAWVVVLGMITSGLKQIKATQISAAAGGPAMPMPTAVQPRVPDL